jgi:hypothetical protein
MFYLLADCLFLHTVHRQTVEVKKGAWWLVIFGMHYLERRGGF